MPDPGLCDGKRTYPFVMVANDHNPTLFAFELDCARPRADTLDSGDSDVTPITCDD